MIERLTEMRIKEVARVADVVGDFCNLKRAGRELTCACPFHVGQHLNHFKINPQKNIYHCFVCGAHGGPIDFLMNYRGAHLSYPDALRYLGQKYGIPVDEERVFTSVRQSAPIPLQQHKELPMLTLPEVLVKTRKDTTSDTFCNWVRGLMWNDAERPRVEKVLDAYHVGHSINGMTLFWQIDEKGRVHTGKMMRYKEDGHRCKEGYAQDWIHSALERAGRRDLYDSDKQQMHTCLYGLHLLNTNEPLPNTVSIVESEKTAILMAIGSGSHNTLWMATGGLQFLTREKLMPLIERGLNIVMYPDRDGETKWRAKAKEINYDKIIINDMFTRDGNSYWTTEDGQKADAADIVVRKLSERNPAHKVFADLTKKSEHLATLAAYFNLEPTNVLTQHE